MRKLIARIILPALIFLCACSPALAETLVGDVANEAVVFGGEAADMLRTPFSTDNNAWLKTLAVASAVGATWVFDKKIERGIESHRNQKVYDVAQSWGVWVGEPIYHLGAAGALFTGAWLADSHEWMQRSLALGEALVLTDATVFGLKHMVGRDTVNPHRFKTFSMDDKYVSFPSGHTATSFAVASVINQQTDSLPIKALGYLGATFVAAGRIYTSAHWASDVIMGAAIGELAGRVACNAHRSGWTVAPSLSTHGGGLTLQKSW